MKSESNTVLPPLWRKFATLILVVFFIMATINFLKLGDVVYFLTETIIIVLATLVVNIEKTLQIRNKISLRFGKSIFIGLSLTMAATMWFLVNYKAFNGIFNEIVYLGDSGVIGLINALVLFLVFGSAILNKEFE